MLRPFFFFVYYESRQGSPSALRFRQTHGMAFRVVMEEAVRKIGLQMSTAWTGAESGVREIWMLLRGGAGSVLRSHVPIVVGYVLVGHHLFFWFSTLSSQVKRAGRVDVGVVCHAVGFCVLFTSVHSHCQGRAMRARVLGNFLSF